MPVNAYDATLPLDSADASTAAAELRAVKARIDAQVGAESVAGTVPRLLAACNFTGATVGTNAPNFGYNVATVQRVSIGKYIITYTAALSNANYYPFATAVDPLGYSISIGKTVYTKTTVSFTADFCSYNGTAIDPATVDLVIFGV